jgi:IS4 transposase
MQDLENILAKFEEIVSPNVCNKLAKEHRFVQRSTSKLSGYEFAQAMMIPNAFIEAETLNSLARRMETINKSCLLSASALAQRMNTIMARNFMQACFAKVLKEVVHKELAHLGDLTNLYGFNRFLIQDSTRAELHEKLSSYFKGSGGVASKASVKFDYIFDYFKEQFIDLGFFPGNKPDQGLADRLIPLLQEGDLVVRDLGYFVLKSLFEIEKAGAYYVSRWKINEDVYESLESKDPLNLAEFFDKTMLDGLLDVEVFVGKNRHPVRLVACLMSEEATNQRKRIANKSASRHGTKISKKKSNLLKYNIFITNIPASMLSSETIMAIYRARWRIEIIFKQWKSCLKIHVFKGFNIERFYCFLYGRLIMILLLGTISSRLRQYTHTLGKELSCYKLINYLIADHSFPKALKEGRIEQYLGQLIKDIPRRLSMDKRKELSLRGNVRIGKSFYKPLNYMELHSNVA